MSHLLPRLLAWLAVAALLTACTSTNYLRLGFRMADAQDLAFAPPVSAIAIVRTGYRTTLDSQATATSVSLLHKLLVRHRFQLRLQQELTVPDSLKPAARQEIYRAIEGIKKHPRLAGGADLPVLNYLLAAQHQRYLLVTAAAGFTQVITKFDVQQAQGLGYRLRETTSTPSPRPIATKAKSNIYLLLYDAQQQSIVYYTTTPPMLQNEPLDESNLEKQFSQMLSQDFPVIIP